MDRYRVKRPKLIENSPMKERSECMSEQLTNAVTPPLRSPLRNSNSGIVSVDLHLMSQSYLSLKHDYAEAFRMPIEDYYEEEGELVLFDPSFGRKLQAVPIRDSEVHARWSVPVLKWCAFCKGEFSTTVEYVPTTKTFWASLGILLAGGVCGCFMAPYYLKSCKTPRLLCSSCLRPL